VEGVHVRGLRKSFGAVTALDAVDFEVGRGEVVALLGENGAGKTTLIRILSTTVLPDSGSASVLGHDVVTGAAKVRSSLGLMLGSERSWYLTLSGRANLGFYAALYGLRRKAASARAAELLAQVGLADAADRPVSGYSAGMRARLALARSLMCRPPVLLLDEPTQSLDPIAAASFRDLVSALAHDEGTAILLATHNLHEAAALATHIVVLARGRVAMTSSGADAGELEAALLATAAAA
jgi:ABC-2 type transport system ATP-binding protein